MRKWSILASLAIILSLTGCNILGSLFGSPEEEEFAVTYHSPDATGGYPAVDSQSYKPGANVTVAGYGTLSRDGYSPSGWRDTIRGITYTPGQSFTMPSVSVNLYIQWSGGTTYTITFDDNALDATGSTAAMNLPAGTVTLSANGFARPGYDFMGWASSSGGPKSYDDQAQFTLSANVTLYAVWQAQVTQYFISFNSNGGTGFMPAQQATGGVPVNLAANIFEAPAGFVFLGWATRADGPKVYNNQASYTGTANVSLYAYWQLQTAQQYVISFNPNAIDATGSTASITQDPGEVILSANGFVRTGYQFMGWATSSDGMVAYTDKANFLLGAANVTLYAIWELDAVDTYTIMFDPNAPVAEVSGTTGPMTAVVDKQVNLTPNGYARLGYVFIGGATSAVDAAMGTVTYANKALFSGSVDLTLYAVWEASVQLYIYYAANDGTGANSLQYVDPDSSVELLGIFVNRSGYDFLGWSTDAMATIATYQATSTFMVGTENVILYAVWELQSIPEYWIYFNPNASGVVGYTVPVQSVTGSVTLPAALYVRTGYDFQGWSTDPAAVEAEYGDGASFELGTSDVTLYAVWSPKSYTVSFNAGGGSTPDPVSRIVWYGLEYETLATTSWMGYIFAGWWTEAGGAGLEITATSIVNVVSDHTLYAYWEYENVYEDIDIGFGDDGVPIDIGFGNDGEEIEIIAN